jgi:hypothetical protein
MAPFSTVKNTLWAYQVEPSMQEEAVKHKQSNHAPTPSEQTLFAIWDAIERVRKSQGEAAAHQLARTALAAIVTAPDYVPASGPNPTRSHAAPAAGALEQE